MKQTLLLFFTLVVAAMSMEDDVEGIASSLKLTREKVQACLNKTNVTLDDIMHFDEVLEDNLQTVDFDYIALKVGCFIACLCQKQGAMTGAHINVDQMKNMIYSRNKEIKPDKIAELNQILDTCANRVRSKTNECEVGLKLMWCGVSEMKTKYYKNNNSNE